jgi:hypothetical protein
VKWDEPEKSGDFIASYPDQASFSAAVETLIEVFPINDFRRHLPAKQISLYSRGIRFAHAYETGTHISGEGSIA